MSYDLRRGRNIRHTSPGVEIWKKGVGRTTTMASTTSFYHCNMSCISLRHPYFDLGSLALSLETLLKLTAEDVREIRDIVVRHLADGLDQ